MIYTCPMHPEIEQDHPGACPKCGMTLESKTVGPEEEEQRETRSLSRKFRFGADILRSRCYSWQWVMLFPV